MSWKDDLKQNADLEKSKLSVMSGKDRLWYIWAYYKFHIVGCLILLFFLYAGITTIYRSTFKTELYCYYLNVGAVENINQKPLTDEFASYMNFGKKQIVASEIGNTTFDDSTSESGYATLMKLTALITTKDLDVIIGDASSIDYYAVENGFCDLSELMPEAAFKSLSESDRFYETLGEDGLHHPYAIRISDSGFTLDSNLDISQKDVFIGIISNSKHKDNSLNLLTYITEGM